MCKAGPDAEKDQGGISKPNSPAGSHNFEFLAGCSENLAQWAGKQPNQPEGNGEGNNNVENPASFPNVTSYRFTLVAYMKLGFATQDLVSDLSS